MLETTSKLGSLENQVQNIPGDCERYGPSMGKFARLRVQFEFRDGRGIAWATCVCDCGTVTAKRMQHLRSGATKSCGCLKREAASANGKKNRKHGGAAPSSRAPEYRSWESARSRCRNPNDPCFDHYGGRGISFCEEWDEYSEFLLHMGPRPPGTTLDRIDVEKGYEPGNCRWADASTQARNKVNSRRHIWKGKMYALPDLAVETGVPYQRLSERINRRGWDVDRAVSTPPRGHRQ